MMTSVYSLEARQDDLVRLPAPPDHEPTLVRPVAEAFLKMRAAAQKDGIDLLVVSGFRSIERQTVIWSRKFIAALSDGLGHTAALERVMEWTLAPGWSRHHWGTDLDLVPASMLGNVRLESADWVEGGVAHAAHLWLEKKAGEFGFMRPYDIDRGGVKPEAWHWSFAELGLPRLADTDRVPWREWLERRPFIGAGVLAQNLTKLYDRYVHGISPRLLVKRAS